jgi:DNA-binding NarL/FixJ family response regulator
LRLFGISIEEFPVGSQIIYKPDISNFELLIDAIRDSKEIGVKTQWVNPPKTNTTDELTDIQVETLRMIVEGFTNKEIGKHEFVSEKAIEQRIGRLASVLGITCSNGQNLRVKLATKYVNWTNGRI